MPSSGAIVFPRLRGRSDARPFVDALMRDYGTAIVPGSFFDAPAHFRLGYGGDTDTLRAGLERVAAALDRHS